MSLTPRYVGASVTFAWYIILWALGLLGWYTARKRYAFRPKSRLANASPEEVAGVSIIRPLKGLDANLFENLESSFTQEYPKFEVLMSVDKDSDRAIPVAKDLLTKYPGVDASLIVGEGHDGVNPKINNLVKPYKQAKYDIIWVMDSNVQLECGALARAVEALDPPESTFIPVKPGQRRIGLIHHVPLGFATEGLLGARIEEAFLNTNHAKMYLAINTIAIDSCVVGKSNMYRRSDVDRLTATLRPQSSSTSQHDGPYGLLAFSKFLAEDNMIAGALWHELDLRHDLSCDVSRNAIGDMDFVSYVWRRIRWIRVRKHMVLAATLIEPFTESIVAGFLGAWSARTLFSIPYSLFLLVHFGLWLTVDLDVLTTISGGTARPVYWSFVQAWMLRELLAFPIWLAAIVGNEVDWRGRKYRITRNGEARKVEAN